MSYPAFPSAAQLAEIAWQDYRAPNWTAARLLEAMERAFYAWRDYELQWRAGELLDRLQTRWQGPAFSERLLRTLDRVAEDVDEIAGWELPDEPDEERNLYAYTLAIWRWAKGYAYRPIPSWTVAEADAFLQAKQLPVQEQHVQLRLDWEA